MNRKEEQLKQDLQWGREHREDSDEALLDYLRAAASELGHTPAMREVLGGHYIAQRFCDWGVALLMAGLPLDNVRKPGKQALEDYRRRCAKDKKP